VSVPIRPAHPDDLDALLVLCAEHAAYERLAPPAHEAAQALSAALWGTAPRASCLVTYRGQELLGYASYSLEFATWTGREYVHLDCLFVRETHRGNGIGQALLARVTEAAAELGAREIQWQTPDWNADAIRFYERAGAIGRQKVRFTLQL
jgi:ribosomal protein S18 acetylase RimI-like enzyme